MEQLPVNYDAQLQYGIWGKQVPRNNTKISINLSSICINQTLASIDAFAVNLYWNIYMESVNLL